MTSSSPTAPDLGGTTVRLRQRTAEPNGLMGVLMVAVIVYTFAGFWVYWLRTGLTRVSDSGTISPLGEVLWVGPLLALMVVHFFIGDRGPFTALYLPRSTIDLDDDGLAWWTASAAGRIAWESIGGVSCLGDNSRQETKVFDPSGADVWSIVGVMADDRTQRATRLPDVVLEVRPDQFEAADTRHPGNGCVRRSAT